MLVFSRKLFRKLMPFRLLCCLIDCCSLSCALLVSAAVFCFRLYSAVHASSLSMRLPSSALFFFSRQIRFAALYKHLHWQKWQKWQNFCHFCHFCQYIFYFVYCAGLQFRVPVLPAPCTSIALSWKKDTQQKSACQFGQFCQFLFSGPWSIQLLLIVKIASRNCLIIVDNCWLKYPLANGCSLLIIVDLNILSQMVGNCW